MIDIFFHDKTGVVSGFPGQIDGFEHADGNGEIHYYRLFDGVGIMLLRLEMEAYTEIRTQIGRLEVNFCVNGRFETSFSMRDLEEFNKELPMGYTAQSERESWGWGKKDNKQYLLLLVVIAIIFFTTSILFNSLKQPLAIIFIIPVSYIGVFLTFYWFKLNFDQGGFASFVLLCGITVNASIYILNEYNAIRRRHPRMSALRAYTKAWNAKILPIFLTVVSTILGFIPFMVGTDKEAFWFPLAAGTIGGLVMSIIGIFFFLPVFVLKKRVGKR